MFPYAEVVGDPIAHSKSPGIHGHWLRLLGIEAGYRRTRVEPSELGAFVAERRSDPLWLGCNVTVPHKVEVAAFLDALDERAQAIGAVNCIVREREGLIGYNTDVDGVDAALRGIELRGKAAIMIGAGGAARAAARQLGESGLRLLSVIVRDPSKATGLRGLLDSTELSALSLDDFDGTDGEPALVINASPLGMAGGTAMPPALLDRLSACAPAATFFDMVYSPVETALLKIGRARGSPVVDGLAMLVGQAGRAFELFYGQRPPAIDCELDDLLAF